MITSATRRKSHWRAGDGGGSTSRRPDELRDAARSAARPDFDFLGGRFNQFPIKECWKYSFNA
jgi:hypothetical protein